jgi:hypothetical protein
MAKGNDAEPKEEKQIGDTVEIEENTRRKERI